MSMMKKLINVAVRELGDRVLEIAGSTEDVDRMGDIIRASGWKLGPFKKNPVFMWGHDYSQPPIGRALKVWVDNETNMLMFNIEFAGPEVYEFADTIYRLYKEGFMHATSVGFIPLEWEGKSEEEPYPKWEGNVFTKQELLELSAVPVPANANALVTARDGGLITIKEFEAVTREETAEPEAEPEPEPEAEAVTLSPEGDVVAEETEAQPEARTVPQEQLIDDLDYLAEVMVKVGLSDQAMPKALALAGYIIQRSTGNDIPDEILTKVGAVLNAKNKGRLNQIRELAQAVLDSAQAADDGDKHLEIPHEPTPDLDALKKERAQDVADVAQTVIAMLKGKRLPK